MSAIIAQFWPYIATLVGGALALLGVYLKGRGDGSAKAENKALKGQIAAKEEQLEMHREANAAERDAAALSDEAARKEAEAWARKKG